MYHTGSLGDLLGFGLSIIITIFWIGYWHVHLISIMYGKWRLHRSTAFQLAPCRSIKIKQQHHHQAIPKGYEQVIDLSPHYQDLAAGLPQEKLGSWGTTPQQQQQQTIIQVETTLAGNDNSVTLFSGELLPGVSILKPLVGVDQYLMHNLETFFLMSYPKFELLFCVPDESDPAIMVVQSLMRKHPGVDARIFIGGENVGVNPKINNMMPGYRASKYDLVLVSDSGIMTRSDTLLDMVYTMLKPDLDRDHRESRLHRLYNWVRNRGPCHGVGLVHQMPFSMDRDEFGFPACLEKVYFGTAHARIYLAADCLGVNCPTGMSALMRKNLLENKGGMGAFGKYLAEDYFFAKAMTDQGWMICISSQPAWQNSAVCHLAHFQGRLERWAKLRFAMVPLATLLEPLQECVFLGILASFAISFLSGLSALGVFLVHVITWFLLDWTLLKTVQHGRLSFSKLDFIISWIFREFTCIIMFIKVLLNPRIEWKNGYYRLQWGGLAEVIKAPPEHLLPVVVSSPSTPSSPRNSYDQGDYLYQRQSLPPDDRELLLQHTKHLSADDASMAASHHLSESSSPKKSSANRIRHVRSRSLPQKNSFFSLFNNISHKFNRNSPVRSTCDDLFASPASFRGRTEREIF